MRSRHGGSSQHTLLETEWNRGGLKEEFFPMIYKGKNLEILALS